MHTIIKSITYLLPLVVMLPACSADNILTDSQHNKCTPDAFPNNMVTVVEGIIVKRSVLPDPAKSDYPNCRFTAHFRGHSIKSGKSCPQKIVLTVEGFENYRVLANNTIKRGDKVICTVVPFEQLPQNKQSTQVADDLNLYLLENYYVVDIKIIKSFSEREPFFPTSGIFFSDDAKDYVSIFERKINPPIPENTKEAQRKSIQEDLEKMNRLLDGYSSDKMAKLNKHFTEVWKSEQKKDPPHYNRVGNNIVWRNIDNSFWALPSRYTLLSKPHRLDDKKLNSLLSLKKVCDANGVQLIISLVPDSHAISARVINKEFRDIPDIQTAALVKQLSEIGIETIYASDKIIQNYNIYPFAFFFPSDGHPGDTTQACLAELLIERIKRYDIPPQLDPKLFSAKIDNVLTYRWPKPYLYPKNCNIGSHAPGSVYDCLHIYYDNDRVKKDKNASIMIIGNSFLMTPMQGSPEALPSFIMYKSLLKTDAQFMNGWGPFSGQLLRLLRSPDSYLKNKRVLIMQVGIWHLINVKTIVDISELDKKRVLHNSLK